MGTALIASKKGFILDLVWERYHERGKEMKKRMTVVIKASLKEIKKGVISIFFTISNITNIHDIEFTCSNHCRYLIFDTKFHILCRLIQHDTLKFCFTNFYLDTA